MTVFQLATALPEDDDTTDAVVLDFASAPPAPATPRKRNRPPQPGTPASGAPSSSARPSDDHSDPHAERLRVVLELVAAGKSQAEIGKHFGRCKRTIASWYSEAKERRAATFRENTAEDIAAEIEARFAKSYSQWTSIVERAQATGNLKLEIMALARMDQSHVQRVQALGRIGYFDNVEFKPTRDSEEDSVSRGTREANLLKSIMNHTLAAGTPYEHDFPEPDHELILGRGKERSFPFY